MALLYPHLFGIQRYRHLPQTDGLYRAFSYFNFKSECAYRRGIEVPIVFLNYGGLF